VTGHTVLADDVAVAFLDARPVFKGHVLVAPREHAETLADLPAATVGPFFLRVQRVSAVMPAALGCQGTFVAANNVVSQSVPHLHVHVVPRWGGDANFITIIGGSKVIPQLLRDTRQLLATAWARQR